MEITINVNDSAFNDIIKKKRIKCVFKRRIA